MCIIYCNELSVIISLAYMNNNIFIRISMEKLYTKPY